MKVIALVDGKYQEVTLPTSAGGGIPYYVPPGETRSIALNDQAPVPIVVRVDGELFLDGELVEMA